MIYGNPRVVDSTLVASLHIPGSESTDTVTAKVKRISDSKYYDFDDDTWKASPTTATAAMTWQGDGIWTYSFDSSDAGADTFLFYCNNSTRNYSDTVLIRTVSSSSISPDAWAGANLTTLGRYKAYAEIESGETDSTFDSRIETMIAAASQFISRALSGDPTHNAEFVAANYTEYHDGDGETGIIYPHHKPIISVTSIHDDTLRTFGSGSLVDSDDYVVSQDKMCIQRISSIWRVAGTTAVFSRGVQNIKLVYRAGFESLPEDLILLANKVTHYFMEKKEFEGQRSANYGEGMVVSTQEDLPLDIRRLMNAFDFHKWDIL